MANTIKLGELSLPNTPKDLKLVTTLSFVGMGVYGLAHNENPEYNWVFTSLIVVGTVGSIYVAFGS